MMESAVLLYNIRSAHNVGSIFRTADGAGVSKIYISGYTPTPIDRFGRVEKKIAKTALDAQEFLPWEQVGDPIVLITQLKKEGWQVVGAEQDARSIRYGEFSARKKTLFVFGTEVGGMTQEMKDVCDVLVEIPMHGKKDSLNVSVAAGIILFSSIKNSIA